jgi:hypothetical protein
MSDIVKRLMGPHEWGYRELTGMGFTPDDAPFDGADEIERLRAQNTEAAAFLDALAANLATPAKLELFANRAMYAGDCRALAGKLRGES